MDLEFLREPSLILFASAMMIEAFVAFEMFFDRNSLPVSRGLKWTTVICFGLFSCVNLWAFQEVYNNTELSSPLITKMLYCATGLAVMGCLHFLNAWAKKYIRDIEAKNA